ncbi:MAG: hypothetical protein GY826_38440, partial [Fuerstiella sp.]|nr:hypothetical protein [Fuerstiella sp.]
MDDGGGGGTADDGTINGNEAVVANGDTVTAAELAKLTWDPAANANGAGYATFTYTLNDGDGNSGSYTATLTVTAANDLPTSSAVTVAGTEDTLKTYAASNFAFSDVDSGDSISRILITIVESTGDLECNNKNGGSTGWTDCAADDYVAAGTDLRLTPASNSVADVTFSFKVHDGTGYSAAAYVLTTTHAADNDAPTTAGDTATVTEDDTGYDGWTADSDWGYSDVENTAMVKILIVTTVSAGTLAVDADAGNDCDSGEEVVAGSTEINDENLGNLEFCPAANSVAQQTFTFKVHDGNSWSGVGTMTISITAQNDNPVAGDTQDQTFYEDVAFSFQTVASTDVDGDTLSHACVETGTDMPGFMSETADSSGQATLGGTAAHADLTGDADGANTYAMTCTVSDGTATHTDTFVITITAINDAPYLSGDGGGAADASDVVEDSALSVTLTATDEESNDVTFSKTSGGSCPSWVTLTDAGGGASTATLTSIAGNIVDSLVGAHTCDITMSDGTSSTLDTYTITITQKNDEPGLTATAVTGTFTEGGSNIVLYSSAAAVDNDATATQTYEQIVITITNVADAGDEYLVIDGSDCLITTAATCVANTA